MKRFNLLLENGFAFAEGVVFSNQKVCISFLYEEFSFIYKSIQEMMSMHSNSGTNKLKYLDEDVSSEVITQ